MNFLQLCQRLRQECGVSGTGPTSVVGQVGEMAEIVSWVGSAYEDIQNLHTAWLFRVQDFEVALTSGVNTYTPSVLGLSDLLVWKKDDVRVYLTEADEQQIQFMQWDVFRRAYLIGTVPTGRPSAFSIKPDNSIVVWPTPDDVFTIKGEYVMQAQTMSANDDEPIFPSDYHMAIVWRALSFYGGLVAAIEKIEHGAIEYKRVMRAMTNTQLPQMAWGSPLA